jgi:hypothetical protein
MNKYKLISGEDIDKLPSFLESAKQLSLPEQLNIIRNVMTTYCPHYMHGIPVKEYLKLLDHVEKNNG